MSFTFFFYGTLCDADVRAVVFGRAVAAEPAALPGYEAVPVAHGRFPILLAQRGREAAGVVCPGLSLADAARLGFYEHEGRDYTAAELSVRAGAKSLQAWTYVPTGALKRGMGRWDLAEWQRYAKRDFLLRVRRWMNKIEPEQLEPFFKLWQARSGAR